MILHITSIKEWKRSQLKGEYAASSLKSDGFIHCSTLDQVVDTANLFFKGQTGLVLLCIDEKKLKSKIVYENPSVIGHSDSTNLFPHVYGAINISAVIRAIDLIADKNGLFKLPNELTFK